MGAPHVAVRAATAASELSPLHDLLHGRPCKGDPTMNAPYRAWCLRQVRSALRLLPTTRHDDFCERGALPNGRRPPRTHVVQGPIGLPWDCYRVAIGLPFAS